MFPDDATWWQIGLFIVGFLAVAAIFAVGMADTYVSPLNPNSQRGPLRRKRRW